VLNIAEGAGKFSRPDKRRYYLTAVGSTTEELWEPKVWDEKNEAG